MGAGRIARGVFLLAALVLIPQGAGAQSAGGQLLNVSYDPTREFYAAYNALFAAYWKKKTGKSVAIQQSHGASGAQSRAVVAGLDADVVTLALAADVDAISRANLLAPDWVRRLPDNSSPYTSTIVFVVRKGNPKHVRDWDDLARPGIGIVTPNPKTSGAARWNFLAAWAYASRRDHYDEAKTRDFVARFYRNAVVLDAASRTATITFAERGLGDVLASWENEALLLQREHPGEYEIVVPSVSILAEPSVAWVDRNVEQHGTQELAKAYLVYLYSEPAQRLACKYGYRPRLTSVLGTCGSHFPRSDLATIDRDFGGWTAAFAKFFAEGGVFDRIYQPK